MRTNAAASEGQGSNSKPADKKNQENNSTKDRDGNNLSCLEGPPSATPVPAAAAAATPVIHRSKGRVRLQESICLESFCKKKEEQKSEELAEEKEEVLVVETAATGPSRYRAVGVVHHIGSTPHSGHYTADAVRSKDLGLFDDSISEEEYKWVTFDDTATTYTDKASVLDKESSQRNTYMAMYVGQAE